MMLRPVSTAAGKLYVGAMPGRNGPVATDLEEIEAAGVTRIVCLAPNDEVDFKSPGYARLLEAGTLPCVVDQLPIPDFGVPPDLPAFGRLMFRAAEALLAGETLLVHCAAGVGRTGLAAVCILIALGHSEAEARAAVEAAGSAPQGVDQAAVVSWFVELNAETRGGFIEPN
jgi:atypical dual specificity phosphatase